VRVEFSQHGTSFVIVNDGLGTGVADHRPVAVRGHGHIRDESGGGRLKRNQFTAGRNIPNPR
jgi:hypothetical protein